MLYKSFTAVLIWCFFSILTKCLFAVIVEHAYFIHISLGSVETHLRCDGTYNNHIIANCLQSVSVKKNLKIGHSGEDMDKSKVPCFYGSPCIKTLV